MRVLYVEDDGDTLEVVTVLLRQAGYEVETATTATDGLKLARQNDFALIILDNWLDDQSGVDLCREIRGFDMHTPILFYSGAASEAEVHEAMEAGAQGYLIKPMGIENLVEVAKELTRNKHRRFGAA